MTLKESFTPARALKLLASILTLALAPMSLGPFIGGLHWFLDLTSHFVAFYAAAAFIALLYFAMTRAWRWTALALVLLLLNLSAVLPWYVGAPPTESDGPTITVLMANVHTSNIAHEKFLSLIDELDPDIVVAQEIDEHWVTSLEAIDSEYPHQLLRPRGDNFGMGLYSKMPLANPRVEQFGDAPVRVLLADIEHEGHALSLIALHTLPPIGGKYSGYRNSQLQVVPTYVRNLPHPVLLIGDLNITMWSPNMKQMARESGLINARKGRGIHGTWPTQYGPFMIPIDHCLYEEPLVVKEFARTRRIGSDHVPILATVALPQNQE